MTPNAVPLSPSTTSRAVNDLVPRASQRLAAANRTINIQCVTVHNSNLSHMHATRAAIANNIRQGLARPPRAHQMPRRFPWPIVSDAITRLTKPTPESALIPTIDSGAITACSATSVPISFHRGVSIRAGPPSA
jgi:hypothetical protein